MARATHSMVKNKMNNNVRPPTLNSATGRGLTTAVQALVSFIIGLILAIWQVPGVPKAVMDFVWNSGPTLLVTLGISTSLSVGIVSFLWNFFFRKSTVSTY